MYPSLPELVFFILFYFTYSFWLLFSFFLGFLGLYGKYKQPLAFTCLILPPVLIYLIQSSPSWRDKYLNFSGYSPDQIASILQIIITIVIFLSLVMISRHPKLRKITFFTICLGAFSNIMIPFVN